MRPCSRALTVIALCFIGACTEPAETEAHTARYARIVTLAPNLTELVFAAGAGEVLVGASAYSDYPPAALDLPRIGDAFAIDHEQLALLRPDLLLAWQGGTPAHVVDELRSRGYRVEVVHTNRLDDVPGALRKIGTLVGLADKAEASASAFAESMESLQRRYGGLEDLRVFYQVSQRPLYTINGDHYISELISLCGGSNIFAGLNELAPLVDVEAVIDRDPEVMLASTDAGMAAFDDWNRWPAIAANRFDNQYLIPADEIGRATPRLVRAAQAVCDALVLARERKRDTLQEP